MSNRGGGGGREYPASGPRSLPSDPGLAGERTMLAWARLGMTLMGLPGALFGYAATQHAVAAGAAAVAAIAGLSLLVVSVRRQRVRPGFVQRGGIPVAGNQVALTSICVLALALTSLVLVAG